MSDDNIVPSDSISSSSATAGSGGITETITVPFSADMTPSQMAKKLRQVSNVMHAMVSNITRYAAVGDGRNMGAGAQVVQQIFGAAAQSDVAAIAIEAETRRVIDPSRLPPPPGSNIGRA